MCCINRDSPWALWRLILHRPHAWVYDIFKIRQTQRFNLRFVYFYSNIMLEDKPYIQSFILYRGQSPCCAEQTKSVRAVGITVRFRNPSVSESDFGLRGNCLQIPAIRYMHKVTFYYHVTLGGSVLISYSMNIAFYICILTFHLGLYVSDLIPMVTVVKRCTSCWKYNCKLFNSACFWLITLLWEFKAVKKKKVSFVLSSKSGTLQMP